MNYLQRFTEYAPEIGAAIRDAAARLDYDFLQELKTDEPTSAAFDVCEAFTVFWWLWHDGQYGRLYSLGSRFEWGFQFKPRHNLSEKTLTDRGSVIFGALRLAFNVAEDIENAGLIPDQISAEPSATTPTNQDEKPA